MTSPASRLVRLPARHGQRRVILEYVADRFEPDRQYAEAGVKPASAAESEARNRPIRVMPADRSGATLLLRAARSGPKREEEPWDFFATAALRDRATRCGRRCSRSATTSGSSVTASAPSR